MIFYARSGDCHIHSNKECPVLAGGQSEHCGYKEISLDKAIKRKFDVCPCVYRDLRVSGRKLTVMEVKSMC
jgi:hypothetical protein